MMIMKRNLVLLAETPLPRHFAELAILGIREKVRQNDNKSESKQE